LLLFVYGKVLAGKSVWMEDNAKRGQNGPSAEKKTGGMEDGGK
jgi:hypothetical protein